MLVQDVNPTTKVKETTRSTGYGQQMQYEDALRKVTYTTKAHLVGPQGDLTGETIVLTLGENGQDIERLEASGEVKMTEIDRITTGDELTYVAAERGIPRRRKGTAGAHVQKDRGGAASRSDGNVLTFSRGADTLKLSGRDDSRSQTAETRQPTRPARRLPKR